MKKMIFLCLITLLGLQIGTAQPEVQKKTDITGSSNRRSTTRVITTNERTRIQEANTLAEEAQSNIVYDEDLTTDATGGNQRAPKAIVIKRSRQTRDEVQLFKTEDGEKLVYSLGYNAFVPVRTREQALRVALDEFQPEETQAGRKLKKRNPNKKGKKAVLATKVAEDRTRVNASEDDEEVIED